MQDDINERTVNLKGGRKEPLSFNRQTIILTASSGSMGLQQSREFKGEIHLLLSDFHMSDEMSGVDLAIAMTVDRPQLKVLLMSGFPDGMLSGHH